VATIADVAQQAGVSIATVSGPVTSMLEGSRLESKKISKSTSVTSQIDEDIAANEIYVGTSDYVPWLTDRKWAPCPPGQSPATWPAHSKSCCSWSLLR
jgi:Myo-inositol-1-phosphate synthase/Bacterial regulatory proteins, lacI family